MAPKKVNNGKTPPAKAPSPAGNGKIISPPRKKKAGPPTHKHGLTTINVFRCGPPGTFTFECVTVVKPDGSEYFVYPIKQYFSGTEKQLHNPLQVANLHGLFDQRVPNTEEEKMKVHSSSGNLTRTVFVRYPEGNESTSETRKVFAGAISDFLQDERFFRYPLRTVSIVDLTNDNDPIALDEYFMNNDIKNFMEEDLGPDVLNENFYKNYTSFAKVCWKYNHTSQWAEEKLGFPSGKAYKNGDFNSAQDSDPVEITAGLKEDKTADDVLENNK